MRKTKDSMETIKDSWQSPKLFLLRTHVIFQYFLGLISLPSLPPSSSPSPFFFPSIEGGKFVKEDEKIIFPLSFTAHHATTDGYHISAFFSRFKEMADTFRLYLS